jgi:hypothetical protein
MEMCVEIFLLCASDQQNYEKKAIQQNKRRVQQNFHV